MSLGHPRRPNSPVRGDKVVVDGDSEKMHEKKEQMGSFMEMGQEYESGGKWLRSKWALLGVNLMVSAMHEFGRVARDSLLFNPSITPMSYIQLALYGSSFLIFSFMTWGNSWDQATTLLSTDKNLIILITLASTFTLICSAFGFYATLTERRPLLAWWCIMLWPCLAIITSVGYVSYKRQLWNLRAKLGHQWKDFGDEERLRIQDNLHCCGFQGPLDRAAASARCYTRSLLPGCLGKLYRFSHKALTICFISAFSIVPFHLAGIFISLLCSNHVNRNFGRRTR
ncbi:hypothetical protein BJ684DRAFT_19567 [Piptocephalis cylindrospora]|uniref:Tetraspanin family-domain-containing protein n=1 Tax=Piptocephalis cylindrospora TaxID=1907219 RepID=A0A4P9Y6Z2_9FUNG|nr:hypothetical protein BJ684DRAFT_19567 [Piptocephalis cylindrospora]|eukprot:RKP13991.1 hypothetical protein BJ684DRAFT_19567 [Piptocephalis cylindrospora]